jgi:glycerophosphoryl diester phosphodiesterase
MIVALLVIAFIVALVATVALAWAGAWNPPKRKESANEYPVFQELPKVMHVAHRGGSHMGPQNTMHTYRRAVNEFKVDVLEIDLQLSSDGHIVLIHDPQVDITTDGDGLVAHMSLSRLQALDAAYWFTEDGGFTYPLRDQGINVPTFLELLDEFSNNQKLVYFLDFKSAEAVEPSLRIIAERGLEKRVILGSVFPSVNREIFNHRHPVSPVVADAATMFKLILLYAIGLMWLYPIKHQVLGGIVMSKTRWVMTERFLKTLRLTGCKVAVFGPDTNTEEDLQFYMDVGVQMLVTDSPNVMRRLLDINKEMEPPSL